MRVWQRQYYRIPITFWRYGWCPCRGGRFIYIPGCVPRERYPQETGYLAVIRFGPLVLNWLHHRDVDGTGWIMELPLVSPTVSC